MPQEYRRKNRRTRFSPSKGYASPRVPGSPLKRSTNSQDHKRRSVTVKSSPSKPQGPPACVMVAKPPIFTKPTSSPVVQIRSKLNGPKNIFSPPRDAPSSSKQPIVARTSVKSRDASNEIGDSTLNGESEVQGPLARYANLSTQTSFSHCRSALDQPPLAKPRPRGKVTPLNNSRSKTAHLPPFRV